MIILEIKLPGRVFASFIFRQILIRLIHHWKNYRHCNPTYPCIDTALFYKQLILEPKISRKQFFSNKSNFSLFAKKSCICVQLEYIYTKVE